MTRCDACGRFAAWADLEEVEHSELDIAGNLDQSWFLLHKEKCR